MLFSSMLFMWIFLPVVIIGNFALSVVSFKTEHRRIRFKNAFLLIASLFFYAWGGIYYLLLMLSSIIVNYVGGILIELVARNKCERRLFLILTIIVNIGMLFFFKYFNMFVIVVENLLAPNFSIGAMISMQGTGGLGLKEIVLPIGISFFTFQAMSYVIDVYTKKASLQSNIFDFALYVSLFPQLIAGPIVKYSDIDLQLRERKETIDLFFSGMKRFCYGLGKKVLISNTFASIVDQIWALETGGIGAPLAWFGMISYTIQIYYDFSGYSDMAIGLGRMFGFEFKENFNYPYTSLSVQEFWRRWHISLSTWFKEYIYIPLGGNRKGKIRTYINLFIVFMLTGVWHGANFTFVFWGFFYGVILIIERLFLGKILEKNPIKILNWGYTILAVMIGWVYFRSETIFKANEFVRQLFSFKASEISFFSYMDLQILITLVFAVLFSGFVQIPLSGVYNKIKNNAVVLILDYSFQLVLVLVSILLLTSGTYNPFIYFQF